MSEEQVRDYWRRLWSEGDVAFAHEFYAPRFLQNDRERTPEAFATAAARWLEHFSDFRADVDRLFAWEDVVVSRVLYSARHVRDIPGVPARGAEIRLSGIDVFRFENGLVVEHLHEADHEAMWEQLGVPLPPG